ncbi:MAG: hypothetical protein ACRBCJ_14570 [Hyphomicrobiaceae bacterium]
MDPHYLPSLYPGVFIGLIIGFASGGFANVAIGSVGGLIGAAAALETKRWLGIGNDFVEFAILILFSMGGAKALLVLAEVIKKKSHRK